MAAAGECGGSDDIPACLQKTARWARWGAIKRLQECWIFVVLRPWRKVAIESSSPGPWNASMSEQKSLGGSYLLRLDTSKNRSREPLIDSMILVLEIPVFAAEVDRWAQS